MKARGEKHHRAKHSDELVQEARDRREILMQPVPQIARELGVPFFTVRHWLRYDRRVPATPEQFED
jgi:hypothetical protein